MGFHQNLPHCLVFATQAMGGVRLQHLHHEMEAQQIMILLWHLQTNTILGKDFTILICTYQIWTGLSELILTNTWPCLWVLDCCLSQLHHMFYEFCIQIQHEVWTIPPICTHDTHIMEAVMDLHLIPIQQCQINTCRMYLQFTMLAEILDHMGMLLLPQVTHINEMKQSPGLQEISTSMLEWLVIHLPSLQCWKLWTHTIQTLFTGNANGICLHTLLGPWLANYQTYHCWLW